MKRKLIPVLLCLLLCFSGCKKKGAQNAQSNSNSSQASTVTTENRAQAQSLLEQGKGFYNDDRDQEAADAFRKAAELDPDLAEAHYRLGLALDSLGQKQDAEEAYKKAVDAYERILRQNPKNADAQFNLGQSYSRLGKYEEAVKAYKQAVHLQEDNADYYYELGMAQNKLANYAEAVAALEHATELDPDNFRAGDALERAKIDLQRQQAIIKHQADELRKQQELKKTEKNSNVINSNLKSPPAAAPMASP